MPTKEELYNKYMNQMQSELEEEQQRSRSLAQAHNSQMSLFNSEQEDNLIRWQLDLREDLDRIYHLLKGHKLDYDADGNLIYVEPDDNDARPFNEFGVQIIMNIMSFYLNRNTILSNYKEDIINWKVLDFGTELSDLVFNRYEEMGMDTYEKIKMFPMIIKELVDTVHSAYLRAYNGGERESLRTARTVTQSEPISRFENTQLNPQRKARWYNPTSWTG